MAEGGAAELKTGRKHVTVFFADLRGFTSFSESAEPEEVIATLAEYHDSLGARIAEYGGTLERFTGDGFMVFFNDPVEQPDHVQRAAHMAIAMRADVEGLRQRLATQGLRYPRRLWHPHGLRNGRLHRLRGTARLCRDRQRDQPGGQALGRVDGGEVLVSGSVLAELKNGFETEPAGTLELKGISRPQQVFRLLGGA